jgi:hypothetical protein
MHAASTIFTGSLAITDFYLFGILEQKLQGIDASRDEGLKSKIRPFSRHCVARAETVIRSLDRKMPVGCRKCKKLLSILAT